jgi:hypothetical protein
MSQAVDDMISDMSGSFISRSTFPTCRRQCERFPNAPPTCHKLNVSRNTLGRDEIKAEECQITDIRWEFITVSPSCRRAIGGSQSLSAHSLPTTGICEPGCMFTCFITLVFMHVSIFMYYLQHERPCCIGYTNSSRRREFVYPIQHGRECCK